MTDVSAVVCAYTSLRRESLARTLRSLRDQTVRPDQVVVVVDHNDGLLAECRRAFPDARVVANSGRRGLSDARNTGITASTSDVIVFIDDDAVAAPHLVEKLVEELLDDEVVAAGGAARPLWETDRPRWFPEEFDWVVGCSYRGLPATRAPVRNLLGCNMAFRRDALDRVEGFRADMGRVGTTPLGCEETELCLRIREEFGARSIVYRPDATVSHWVGAERTTWRYFLRRCYSEGLSKAAMSRIHPSRALAPEWRYVTHTLSTGIARHLRAAVRGDPGGLARASAIAAGLAATTIGYLRARKRRLDRHPPVPLLLRDVDPDRLERVEPEKTLAGDPYRRVRLMVRSGDVPWGMVEVDLPPSGLGRDQVEAAIAAVAAPKATAHPLDPIEPISVVVATRDRPEALRRCLRSLTDSTLAPHEIVVVENTPHPGSGQQVASELSMLATPIRYVWEPRAGLARAHNAGWRQTTAPLIAFTDDDVVVDPGWLLALSRAFSAHPDAGCVTGLIYPLRLDEPGQLRMEAIGFAKGFAERVFRLEERADLLWPLAVGVCGSGANMAFRRVALAAIKGFDPRLGAGTRCRGGDDLAAFFDVLTAGWAIVYRPQALVRHDHDGGNLPRRGFAYGTGLGSHLARAVLRRPGVLMLPLAGGDPGASGRSRAGGLPRVPWLAGLAWGPVTYALSFLDRAERIGDEEGRRVWR